MLPSTPRDGATARDVLWRAGIETELCESVRIVADEVQRGAAAVLLPEEAIRLASQMLALVVAQQAPWSDLPVLVLTRQGADSADASLAVSALGNVTLLERPVRVATLVSTVRTALRARERQYQIRRHLADLRDADRRKDEFLATLGHELRNPLSPLLTSLELLRISAPAEPIVGKVVGVMQRQASHLVRLVDDLLEVSRITRGLIEVQREPVELSEVVAAAVETSRPIIEASEHHLTVDVPRAPLTVLGDSVRLTQVFANLLNNAAKYTDPGGSIEIIVRHTRHTAFISVRDNGIGIDSQYLPSVFDMFTQVSRSDRRTQGGLGIGLTLVRSLVTLHGGAVSASSDGPGRGSTFEVRLPLAAAEAPAHHAPNPRRGCAGWRVLVVGTILAVLAIWLVGAAVTRYSVEQMAYFAPIAVCVVGATIAVVMLWVKIVMQVRRERRERRA